MTNETKPETVSLTEQTEGSQAGAARAASAGKRPLPPAKTSLLVRCIAALMRPAKPSPARERSPALTGAGSSHAAPVVLPVDPEVVLGVSKTGASLIWDLAGENKGLAIAGGAVLLVGLGIVGLMKLSAASKKRKAAGVTKPAQPDLAERDAGEMDATGLQAPQFAGHYDPTLTSA